MKQTSTNKQNNTHAVYMSVWHTYTVDYTTFEAGKCEGGQINDYENVGQFAHIDRLKQNVIQTVMTSHKHIICGDNPSESWRWCFQ